MTEELRGVIAAAATPLRPDLSIDRERLVEHCGWLLEHGCDAINLLGTTGEATSFSTGQRLAAMQAVAGAGLPMARFMVGTGAAALADAVELTKAARELGFAGALVLPPFYYKGLDDAALLGFFTALIERVGEEGLDLYLYNFPQNSGITFSLDFVQALKKRFPETLRGLKDSSGDMAYAAQMARSVADFAVFPSAEGAIGDARARGYAGCISATANLTAPFAAQAWRGQDTPEGAAALAKAVALRAALASVNVIAGTKWGLARLLDRPDWALVQPPLRALTAAEIDRLETALAGTAFGELRG